MKRQVFLAVVLSAVTAFLFAVALVLGAVVLNARLHPARKDRPAAAPPGPVVMVPDKVYNLSEANRFLKATLVLELEVEHRKAKEILAFGEEMKKREAQISDIVIRVINGRTFMEVNSPRGKGELKEAIRKELNKVLARGEVKTVLFTSFAAQ